MSSCWAAACPTFRACTPRCRASGHGTCSPTTSRPAWRDPSTATRAAFAAPHGYGAGIRELLVHLFEPFLFEFFLLEPFLLNFAFFEVLFFELLLLELFLLESFLFERLLLRSFAFEPFLFQPLFLDYLASRRALRIKRTCALFCPLGEPLLVACGLEKGRHRLQQPWRRALARMEVRGAVRRHFDGAQLRLHDRAALVDLVVAAGLAARVARLEMGRLVVGAAHPDRHHGSADLVLVPAVFADPAGHRAEGALREIDQAAVAVAAVGHVLGEGGLGVF